MTGESNCRRKTSLILKMHLPYWWWSLDIPKAIPRLWENPPEPATYVHGLAWKDSNTTWIIIYSNSSKSSTLCETQIGQNCIIYLGLENKTRLTSQCYSSLVSLRRAGTTWHHIPLNLLSVYFNHEMQNTRTSGVVTNSRFTPIFIHLCGTNVNQEPRRPNLRSPPFIERRWWFWRQSPTLSSVKEIFNAEVSCQICIS